MYCSEFYEYLWHQIFAWSLLKGNIFGVQQKHSYKLYGFCRTTLSCFWCTSISVCNTDLISDHYSLTWNSWWSTCDDQLYPTCPAMHLWLCGRNFTSCHDYCLRSLGFMFHWILLVHAILNDWKKVKNDQYDISFFPSSSFFVQLWYPWTKSCPW